MTTLTLVGTAAAALIAIGTVLRWTLRRLVRGARWAAAVIELPETVERLAVAVDTLKTSVDVLSESVNGLQNTPSTQELSRVSVLPL